VAYFDAEIVNQGQKKTYKNNGKRCTQLAKNLVSWPWVDFFIFSLKTCTSYWRLKKALNGTCVEVEKHSHMDHKAYQL